VCLSLELQDATMWCTPETMLITSSYICYSAGINMWPAINEPSRRQFSSLEQLLKYYKSY
jgi:hypothetical protein